MTRFRHLPPVHSPLRARSLAAGIAALAGDDRAGRVGDLVERDWRARDVLLTASGTDALVLALGSAAADRQAPVALPAWGCYDLATAAAAADLPVVLYDVDPETLAPEPASFGHALATRPCAVVAAHLYGLPVDVPALAGAAASAGALLIEDAAQGAGAALRGRPAGALADVAVLSFGRGKGITGGGGGALLASAAGQAVVRHGRLRAGEPRAGWGELGAAMAQWLLSRPGLYALPAALPWLRLGETVYRAPVAPRRISRTAAAVLATGWERSLREPELRRRNARRLLAALHAAGARVPRLAPGGTAGWLRLPVLAEGELLARARTPAARRLGITPGYPRALCDLEGFRARVLNRDDAFEGARRLARSLITLPTHSLLRERDLRALEVWIAGEPAPSVGRDGAPVPG